VSRPRFIPLIAAFVLAGATLAGQQPAQPQKPGAAPAVALPVLVLDTVKGVIELELNPADAPKSVAHVLELAKQGFYRGQRFHWAVNGVAQFGDPASRDATREQSWGLGGSGLRGAMRPIGVAELSKKPFIKGTVGLAHPTDRKPEEADSQVFILTAPNSNLNGKYAMLGKVLKGQAVADKIEKGDSIRNLTVR
jgi:peptidylprolyl isomerase